MTDKKKLNEKISENKEFSLLDSLINGRAAKLEDLPAPIVTPVEVKEDTCPKCKKGQLQIKNGKYGTFIGCNMWPACSYTANAPGTPTLRERMRELEKLEIEKERALREKQISSRERTSRFRVDTDEETGFKIQTEVNPDPSTGRWICNCGIPSCKIMEKPHKWYGDKKRR